MTIKEVVEQVADVVDSKKLIAEVENIAEAPLDYVHFRFKNGFNVKISKREEQVN